MKTVPPFCRILLHVLLFTVVFASAMASSFTQRGGLYPGAIIDIRYTPDDQHLIIVCATNFNDSPYTVLRYDIATGHTDTLLQFYGWRSQLSPDGSLILYESPSEDRNIVVQSLSPSQPPVTIISTYPRAKGGGYVTFTEDSQSIVFVTDDTNTVYIERYSAFNGALLSSFALNQMYQERTAYAVLSGDGEMVVVSTRNGNRFYYEFWNTKTGEHIIRQRPSKHDYFTFNKTLFIHQTYTDSTVEVYDIASGDRVAVYRSISSPAILLPGGYLASRTLDKSGTLQQWHYRLELLNIVSGENRSVPFMGTHETGIHSPRLYFPHHPDSSPFTASLLADAYCEPLDPSSAQTGFGLYSPLDGSIVGNWPEPGHVAQVKELAVSPDGRYGASSGDDYNTWLWDISNGIPAGNIAGSGALVFSPDGTALIRANILTSALEKIAIPSMTIEHTAPPVITQAAITLRFSPDGRRLLCTFPSGVLLYTYPELQLERILASSSPSFTADAGFTADGNIVIVTCDTTQSGNHTIEHRSPDGALLSQATYDGDIESNSHVRLSADGSLFVTSLYSKAAVHRTDNGAKVRQISLSSIPSGFTPDGKYMLRAYQNSVNRNDFISYYHNFTALSLRSPAEDFTFDVFVPATGYPGLLAVVPPGSRVMYACNTLCNVGRIYFANLGPSPTPLIISDTHTLPLDTIYTGTTRTMDMKFVSPTPLPGIISRVALSDSSLSPYVSLQYSRTLPDTVTAYSYTSYYTPKLTLKISPLYAEELAFDVLVYVRGHNTFDTLRIPVTATIAGPNLTLDVKEIDFGLVPVGSRVERSFSFRSNNDAWLYLTSASVDDPTYQAAFSINRLLPLLLQPQAVQSVTVSYVPDSENSLDADFVLITNDPLRPELRIPLRGKGLTTVDVQESDTGVPSVTLAPNPATSLLTVTLPAPVQHHAVIELLSTEGRKVAYYELRAGEQTVSMNTSAFPSGVYYCRITTQAGIETRPVLVIH